MEKKLKVKIFKKSKNATYPKHITVKRPALDQFYYPYNDIIHLYFDKGTLMRLVHLKKAPEGQKVWDRETKGYVDLEPKQKIAREFVNENGEMVYKKGTVSDNPFIFGYLYPNNTKISFMCNPDVPAYFKVLMDSQHKCLPNYIDNSDNVAEITEIYPHGPQKSLFRVRKRENCR